jgi:hypothetical protein
MGAKTVHAIDRSAVIGQNVLLPRDNLFIINDIGETEMSIQSTSVND